MKIERSPPVDLIVLNGTSPRIILSDTNKPDTCTSFIFFPSLPILYVLFVFGNKLPSLVI